MAEGQPPKGAPLKVVTTTTYAEASMIVGELEAAGIRATQWPGGPRLRKVCVEEQDLDRAHELLSAEPMSEDELIKAEEEAAATQLTRPNATSAKGGVDEPVEVPAPKRHLWQRVLRRAAKPDRDAFGRLTPDKSQHLPKPQGAPPSDDLYREGWIDRSRGSGE